MKLNRITNNIWALKAISRYFIPVLIFFIFIFTSGCLQPALNCGSQYCPDTKICCNNNCMEPCPSGFVLDENYCACVHKNIGTCYLNGVKKYEICPAGTHIDSELCKCVPDDAIVCNCGNSKYCYGKGICANGVWTSIKGPSQKVTPTPTPTPATPQPSPPPAKGSPVIISSGQSSELFLSVPNSDKVSLFIEARIDYPTVAGAAELLRITVNNRIIQGYQLKNKNLAFHCAGISKTYNYYNNERQSWYLFYSPDFFQNNVGSSTYRVVEGNAYQYLFDISDYVTRGQQNKIILQNVGNELAASATPNEAQIYRSVKIVISNIYLQ